MNDIATNLQPYLHSVNGMWIYYNNSGTKYYWFLEHLSQQCISLVKGPAKIAESRFFPRRTSDNKHIYILCEGGMPNTAVTLSGIHFYCSKLKKNGRPKRSQLYHTFNVDNSTESIIIRPLHSVSHGKIYAPYWGPCTYLNPGIQCDSDDCKWYLKTTADKGPWYNITYQPLQHLDPIPDSLFQRVELAVSNEVANNNTFTSTLKATVVYKEIDRYTTSVDYRFTANYEFGTTLRVSKLIDMSRKIDLKYEASSGNSNSIEHENSGTTEVDVSVAGGCIAQVKMLAWIYKDATIPYTINVTETEFLVDTDEEEPVVRTYQISGSWNGPLYRNVNYTIDSRPLVAGHNVDCSSTTEVKFVMSKTYQKLWQQFIMSFIKVSELSPFLNWQLLMSLVPFIFQTFVQLDDNDQNDQPFFCGSYGGVSILAIISF